MTAARAARSYIEGVAWTDLLNDREKRNALAFEITIISEASRRLSDTFRAAHGEVPWVDIIGMRNRLVHEYDEIDVEEVWMVVVRDLPELLAVLEPLLPPP